MLDSLKTVSVSVTGIGVTWIEWLPVAVRVLVGLASFVYICAKIKNENNDEFGVKVDNGCSFIYGVDLDGGVVDTMDSADAAGITPDSFGDLVDITCAANTAACDVEVFVAST